MNECVYAYECNYWRDHTQIKALTSLSMGGVSSPSLAIGLHYHGHDNADLSLVDTQSPSTLFRSLEEHITSMNECIRISTCTSTFPVHFLQKHLESTYKVLCNRIKQIQIAAPSQLRLPTYFSEEGQATRSSSYMWHHLVSPMIHHARYRVQANYPLVFPVLVVRFDVQLVYAN